MQVLQIQSTTLQLTTTILPHKVKTQYVHFRSRAEYFILHWKFLMKKTADN